MAKSKEQKGTAILSKSQRAQLAEFRQKNYNLLKSVKVHEIVQIWRDGFICGAIHGFDQGRLHQIRKAKHVESLREQQQKSLIKLKARRAKKGKICKRGNS